MSLKSVVTAANKDLKEKTGKYKRGHNPRVSLYTYKSYCALCGVWHMQTEGRCPDCNRLLRRKPRYVYRPKR